MEEQESGFFQEAYRQIIEKLQHWYDNVLVYVPETLLAILIVIAFFLAARYVRRYVFRIGEQIDRNNTINNLFAAIASLSTILIGVLVALSVLDLDKTVTSFLAGAGIIGIAIGFAFQDLASNFIAGIYLAIRQPIKKGDLIEIKEFLGFVEEMDLRMTIVRTFGGQLVFLPNKDIFQNAFINYAASGLRRVDIPIGVSYGENLERVAKIACESIVGMEKIRQEPAVEVVYTGFGNSSIDFLLRFWIDYPKEGIDFFEQRSEAIIRVKKAFDREGITIPFPIRTLDFGIKGGEKLSQMALRVQPENAPEN